MGGDEHGAAGVFKKRLAPRNLEGGFFEVPADSQELVQKGVGKAKEVMKRREDRGR